MPNHSTISTNRFDTKGEKQIFQMAILKQIAGRRLKKFQGIPVLMFI